MGILSLLLAASLSGPWTGSYSLGGSAQLGIRHRRQARGGCPRRRSRRAPDRSRLATRRKVVFRLPGAPAPLVFSGRLTRGKRIRGTVRQGAIARDFRRAARKAPSLVARGVYAGGGRTVAVVDDPYGPARLLDLDTGEVHALYPSGSEVRRRLRVCRPRRRPRALRASPGRAQWSATAAPSARLPSRQLEVRFRSGGVTLAGTLTLPPGAGPHPAVAWVHGSGRTTRAYLPDFQALLLHHGVAVLAYDKRGVGQSGGSFPGDRRTRPRSTCSRAMPRPPPASWRRGRRSTTTVSASPATARADGSSRGPPRASRPFASPSSSRGRP